jgi:hypothetical protein
MSAARFVQTLAGPVRYVDSGWTEAEWQRIEGAMARCSGAAPAPPADGMGRLRARREVCGRCRREAHEVRVRVEVREKAVDGAGAIVVSRYASLCSGCAADVVDGLKAP